MLNFFWWLRQCLEKIVCVIKQGLVIKVGGLEYDKDKWGGFIERWKRQGFILVEGSKVGIKVLGFQFYFLWYEDIELCG